jgi:hypothetical protein
MKKLFLLAASISVVVFVSAQASPGHNNTTDDRDPSAPNGSYPPKGVDTPHFQVLPAEGISGGKNADKFCAAMVGGNIAIIYKGKTIIENHTFPNGTIIFKDGTVVDKNGVRRILKKGECIDNDGNPIY